MSDDLVKRLVELDVYDDCDIANLVNEAADRIEKDAQHIDEMYGLVAAMNADHLTNKTRIEQLEAANLKAALIKVDDQMRIEQLEAALREIVGALDDPKGGQHVYDMRNASYIARKALEGKDG